MNSWSTGGTVTTQGQRQKIRSGGECENTNFEKKSMTGSQRETGTETKHEELMHKERSPM